MKKASKNVETGFWKWACIKVGEFPDGNLETVIGELYEAHGWADAGPYDLVTHNQSHHADHGAVSMTGQNHLPRGASAGIESTTYSL
jgi:hypothetical protein